MREKHSKRNRAAFISTDLSLSDSEIITIYGKRWSIEVFFKICKSYLALTNEFLGLSYDMLVGHSTIVFTRYIMLAVNQRRATDERTIGELFYHYIEEISDIQFSDALKLIFQLLKNTLQKALDLPEAGINKLLGEFIERLPTQFKPKTRLSSCET